MLYTSDMAMRRKEPHGSVSETLVALRLPEAMVEEIDGMGPLVGTTEKPASRSRVMREAIRIGLRELARRYGKDGSR